MKIVRYAILVVDAFLALDFILRSVSANVASSFVLVVERVGSALASPFYGALHGTIDSHRWADLIALVIYTLAALVVGRLARSTVGRFPRLPLRAR